jgi:hypothetical protein
MEAAPEVLAPVAASASGESTIEAVDDELAALCLQVSVVPP